MPTETRNPQQRQVDRNSRDAQSLDKSLAGREGEGFTNPWAFLLGYDHDDSDSGSDWLPGHA